MAGNLMIPYSGWSGALRSDNIIPQQPEYNPSDYEEEGLVEPFFDESSIMDLLSLGIPKAVKTGVKLAAPMVASTISPSKAMRALNSVLPKMPPGGIDFWRNIFLKKEGAPISSARLVEAAVNEKASLQAIKDMLGDAAIRENLRSGSFNPSTVQQLREAPVRARRIEWPIKLQQESLPRSMFEDRLAEAAEIAVRKPTMRNSPKASSYLSPELKESISKQGYTAGNRRDILTSFGTTEERKALIRSNLDRLDQFFNEFGNELKGGRVYAGGSFTSAKPNPSDIDLVIRFPESLYRKDLESYNSLLNDIATLDRYYSSVAPQIHFVPTENLRHLDKFRTVGKMRYGPNYTWQRLLGLGGAALPLAGLLEEGYPQE